MRHNASPRDVLSEVAASSALHVLKGDTVRIKTRLGLRIAELRSKRGLTQEQLAEMIAMSPRQMQRLEAGHANPALEKLTRLAAALRCNMRELFTAPARQVRRAPGRPIARLPHPVRRR